MATNAVANQAAGQAQAKFSIGDATATPVTYTAVASVRTLKGPSQSRATIDVTSLDSGGAKEYIVGLTDSGTVSFTIDYNPTAHEALRALTTINPFKIDLPGVTTSLGSLTFDGVVTKFEWDFDETKQMTASVEIQVTGAVAFTAGA